MLLKEVRVLTDLQVISESRETGVMCIRGTFQRAEEANHNQRIYPKAVLENCVKSLTEKLSGRELVGELDHPADGVVKLQNASHLITKLEWQGNDLIGEAEILPTPAGQIAKSLINAGVKIGISSRGMGTLSESARGAKIVNDDYKMITFDLVADPSTKGAYPSLAESRQHAIDFVENVIKPAISEKAFVARLKKKLNESKANQEEFSKFEILLEGERRVNRQLASRNISAAERARIAAKRKAQEKHRFDSKPPVQPKKSAKAKRHDDNIAEIHKRMRQLGDERIKDERGPQYESRRDAARAKLEEMCGPKKHGKKKLKKLSESYSVAPLTLTTLLESGMINEGIGDFFSGIKGVLGGDRKRRASVMSLKARRLQGGKDRQDGTLMSRDSADNLRTPNPNDSGLLSRVRMRQGARARYGSSPGVTDKQLRTVGTDAAAGRARRRQDIKSRLQAMSKKSTPTFGAVPDGNTTPRPAGNLRRVRGRVD